MLSVVIPMYNEEDNAQHTLEKLTTLLTSLKQPYELIAVDDGSKDNTLQILQRLKKTDKHLTVLPHGVNKGPGAAFRTGFAAARGDIIITLDADLSFSPDYIPDLLEALKDADVVIGSQHMKGAGMENIPAWRVFVSKTAVFLDRLMLHVPLTSLSSFFVAYRRDAIKKIVFHSDGFDAQCEILAKLYKKGYRIKEIPCVLRWSEKRKNRLSVKKLFREISKRFRLWASIRRDLKNESSS